MRVVCLALLFLNAFLQAPAQLPDTLTGIPQEDPGVRLEDMFQDADTDIDFDFNTAFENLDYYRQKPLNLNTAGEAELNELGLLSTLQVNRLLQYRQTAGPLIAIYELQAVPGFDLETIRRILPYVGVKAGLDDYQMSISRFFTAGKNELYLRWERFLDLQRGYLPADDPDASRYQGSPDHYYLRFKHSFENKFSFGLTAEKDPGEEFFQGSNAKGFDFYSAHIFLREYNRLLRAVALGDYTVRFGQGLILYNGFGYGKGSLAMNVKRSGRVLSPFTSVNEASFFRGAAVTLGLRKQVELTAFASRRLRDGNLVSVQDTTQADELAEVLNLSSLFNSGLHRTPNEIADRNAFSQGTAGARLAFQTDRFQIALNAVYDQLDKPLIRRPQVYNRFYFNGDRLFNASIDYGYRQQNLNLFGETAISDNGALATINGLLLGLDRKMDLSLLFRSFARDFQTLNGQPFAETIGANNETGIYLGMEVRPNKFWRLNGYIDLWKHPWARFRIDGPSTGHDWLFRITYYEKRKLEAYWQLRGETKAQNAPEHETKTDFLLNKQLFISRLQLAYQVNKALELRTRLSTGFFDNGIQEKPSTGFLIYQDVIFKPMAAPLSFTTRFAIFDTDEYNIRFYTYENDLLYSFSIPSFSGRGTRFYLNLRYKGIRNLTLEARFAQVYFPNTEFITVSTPGFSGRSLNSFEGQAAREVKAQIKYQF